jgi:hypothetical protein
VLTFQEEPFSMVYVEENLTMMKKAGAWNVIKTKLPFRQESKTSEHWDPHVQPTSWNRRELVTLSL